MNVSKIKSGMKSLFTAAKNKTQGIDQSVPERIALERQSICDSCPHKIKLTNQCGDCKCFLNFKTKLRQEKCPQDKWLAWEPENING